MLVMADQENHREVAEIEELANNKDIANTSGK